MTPTRFKGKKVLVMLTERQVERLKAMTERTYRPMAQLIREAVDRYLDELEESWRKRQ